MDLAKSDKDVASGAKPKGVGEYLVSHLRQYGLLFALIAVMAFFQIVTDGTLLKAVNVTNLLLQNSYIIIMALGMLIVIVAGHIDLSVGSVMGFIGALAAVMMVNHDQSMLVTVIVCLVAGAAIGAAQGYWVAYWKIPSFIVTLAGMLVFRGSRCGCSKASRSDRSPAVPGAFDGLHSPIFPAVREDTGWDVELAR
jgi:putative multiple sugar transport system permease protein